MIAQNWLNLSGERGLSSFDPHHSASFQVQYSTGVGVRGGALLSGWRGLLIKEWTFVDQITLAAEGDNADAVLDTLAELLTTDMDA